MPAWAGAAATNSAAPARTPRDQDFVLRMLPPEKQMCGAAPPNGRTVLGRTPASGTDHTDLRRRRERWEQIAQRAWITPEARRHGGKDARQDARSAKAAKGERTQISRGRARSGQHLACFSLTRFLSWRSW